VGAPIAQPPEKKKKKTHEPEKEKTHSDVKLKKRIPYLMMKFHMFTWV
jgi:hypothetical protein